MTNDSTLIIANDQLHSIAVRKTSSGNVCPGKRFNFFNFSRLENKIVCICSKTPAEEASTDEVCMIRKIYRVTISLYIMT
ncbi:unnamed protein product [Lasius platythorax]|uniref:Uncharacterized protein n=1 Tax=Lasius platythorax TaxID=488582 RepID=A0AAV2P0P7_9HYME